MGMTHPKGRPWTEEEKAQLRQEQEYKKNIDYLNTRDYIGRQFIANANPVVLSRYQLTLLLQRINFLEGGPRHDIDFYHEDGIRVYRDYPGLYDKVGGY